MALNRIWRRSMRQKKEHINDGSTCLITVLINFTLPHHLEDLSFTIQHRLEDPLLLRSRWY